MKKCLKIILKSSSLDTGLRDSIQIAARELDLEGTIQLIEQHEIIIIACGSKENIDDFLDEVHEGFGGVVPEDVQIEPFLKEKDYRGTFRILE